MPFLGTTPLQGFVSSVDKQSFTPNGILTSFTLNRPVTNANDLEVFVGNVRQEPTAAYTAAGNTLDFGTGNAPPNGVNFYVIYKNQAQVTTTPPDGSVSSGKLDTNITVAGTLGVTGISKFANGTNSAPSITFTSDTDTGIYKPVANNIALVNGGVENFRLSDGFISYGNGDNSRNNSMRQNCGSEELTPTSTTNGATETVTGTRNLPYQILTPVIIKIYVHNNSAVDWNFQQVFYSTYHGSYTTTLANFNGTPTTYFDTTPAIGTSGDLDNRKITVQLNTATNTNPAAWRVLLEYGIGGPT